MQICLSKEQIETAAHYYDKKGMYSTAEAFWIVLNYFEEAHAISNPIKKILGRRYRS